MDYATFLLRLPRLRVDRANGPPRPYKPLLVASVLVLLHKGKLPSPELFLDGALRSVFFQLLNRLFPDWPTRPQIEDPFRHLQRDGLWTLVANPGEDAVLSASLGESAKSKAVLRHVRCARLPEPLFSALASSPARRLEALQVLAAAWFPAGSGTVLAELLGEGVPAREVLTVSEPPVFTERMLEEHLEREWASTPFAQEGVELSTVARHGLPGRQVLTPLNSIDLLGFRARRRQWWVFELKRARTSDAVVGQVSRYLGWLQERAAANGDEVRGAILVGGVDDKLCAATRANERLSLWQFDGEFALRCVVGERALTG